MRHQEENIFKKGLAHLRPLCYIMVQGMKEQGAGAPLFETI